MTRLALTGARLLDGEQPPVDGVTVVVEGDRIAEITTGSPSAAADEVYDLAGRTLMPGMFTCHFHATYHELGSQPNTPYGDEYPPSYLAMIAARNFQTALAHGYTGVVGAGGSHEVEPGVKRAIQDGLIPGPRVWASSRELSTTGHSNDGVPWHWGMAAPGAVRLCDGADSFRLGVREEIKRGADVIKLFVTGGHGTTAPKHQMEMTEAELAAAIDAAHQRGRLIRGHLVNKRAIMLAIELGIDIVDHCDEMDDEVIAALVERGTFVVPSLHFPKHFLETFGSGLGFAADAIRADLAHMCEMIPKAQAAGVRFLLGDDYGAIGFGHGMYGAELRLYVEHAGVTPLDVIGWATRNGAAAVGRDADLGAVAVGKLADLLVVDGDPSADIGALADHRPLAVLKGGEVVSGSLETLRRTPRSAGVAAAHAHAAAEAAGDLDTTMATLVDDPVYELQPAGLAFRGAAAAREYYEHFFSTFQPTIAGYALLSEWITDEGVGQEYELTVDGPDGPVAHHIIGILVFGEGGKLAGERLYASDDLFRVMVGPALAHAEPLARLPSRVSDPDEVARRIGLAWRELRRGASMTVLREQFLGVGDDALEPGQMDTLDVLLSGDSWRMSDLAEALRVDPSTATRAVDRLTRIQLAERLPDPDDKRVVLVRATDAGRRRHDEAFCRWKQVMREILSEFDGDEREELASHLERLVLALDRVVGTPSAR